MKNNFNKIKLISKIFGQIITILTIFTLGFFLISLKKPGNGAICDPEQLFLFATYVIFLISAIGIIINSIFHYKRNNWKIYRIITIIFSSIMIYLVMTINRERYLNKNYGKLKYEITSKNSIPVIIDIKLYENNKFFAYTYDGACESENIGTYKLSNKKLILNFENKKSEYLNKTYDIKENKIFCNDSNSNVSLIFIQK